MISTLFDTMISKSPKKFASKLKWLKKIHNFRQKKFKKLNMQQKSGVIKIQTNFVCKH
jgi:hypothetical protein